MDAFIQTHEATLRLAAFFGIFALMALWELRAPRRALTVSKALRWGSNLGLLVLNTILLRLLFPVAAVGLAATAAAQGWGLLNHFAVPFWLAVPLAVIALDLVIWLQHVMVHAVPALWQLHRVHHADLDYDLTTGARFHPLEIVLSMLIKLAVILVLGPPVVAVILFEVILNGMAMFNHGNVGLPDCARPAAALGLRHPGYAPGPPLGGGRRDQLEFRLQPLLVGPPLRDLPRGAPRRATGDDHRHRRPPRPAGGGQSAGDAGPALPWRGFRLRHQPADLEPVRGGRS